MSSLESYLHKVNVTKEVYKVKDYPVDFLVNKAKSLLTKNGFALLLAGLDITKVIGDSCEAIFEDKGSHESVHLYVIYILLHTCQPFRLCAFKHLLWKMCNMNIEYYYCYYYYFIRAVLIFVFQNLQESGHPDFLEFQPVNIPVFKVIFKTY